MDTQERTARLAGWCYLVVVLAGPFTLLYVPGRIVVAGDPSATIANLRDHESLFVAGILVGLVSELAFVAAIVLLHRLLAPVDRMLALAMVIAIGLVIPLSIAGAAHEAATLALVRNAQMLSAFTGAQRDALVAFMLLVDQKGTLIAQVFWGLWLLPLGSLVHRSGFLPRPIGVWLVLNGLAYVALSVVGLLAPERHAAAFAWATPILFGEVALTLWLIARGVRPRSATRAA